MAYSDTITEATGVTNPSHLIVIEDCMRDIIFHSTLDWQDRETFKKGAREALEVCVAMGDIPKPTVDQIFNTADYKKLRSATGDARKRTDKLIAVAVKAGKYQVQEIIPKGNTSDVIPLSPFLSMADATARLERL